MDFGVVGLDHHHHGLGISSSNSSSPSASFGPNNVISSSSSSDPETKHRLLYGSGLSCNNNSDVIKHERPVGSSLEEYWRSSKLAKTGTSTGYGVVSDDDFSSVCKGMMFEQRGNNNNNPFFMRSNSNTASTTTTLSFLDNEQQQQHYNQQSHQMLSFSAPNSSTKSETHTVATLPYFPTAYPARNTGALSNGSQGQNPMGGGGGVMMMMRSGGRAAFTASQWMELEHQALIYKYMTSNIPIPTNLLIPIRNSFDSSPFLRSNPLGVAFHLGFSNNTDPEPGRCRRTDGKKWRCSRDAVVDQKYCERHMNRGRHRSRKPVEGQQGANSASAKSLLLPTPNNATFEINPTQTNRKLTKESSCSSLLFPRKQQVSYDATRSSDLDSLISSDPQSQGSLHQFIDDWPNRGMSLASPWTDRTQLSISIPNSTETNLSPLRLSTMGGPLGEVLHHTNNNNAVISVLNLMPEGWESSPPSPTGVLQKTAFGSLSNSSAGSSPRAATVEGSRTHQAHHQDGIDLLGVSSSFPAL